MQRAPAVSRLVAQRRVSLTWPRHNLTLSNNQSFVSSLKSLPRKPRDAAEARIGYDGSPNSVRVYFWHAPRDSADVLATIQYIEQLYGPIDEFSCPSVDNDRKALTLFIRFRDKNSASRAREMSKSHRIPVPKMSRPDPLQGGISLASLESFLEVKPRQPELKPEISEPDPSVKYDYRKDALREYLYFQIQNAFDIRSAPPRYSGRSLSRTAMHAFVHWAGFTSIKPLPIDTPLFDQRDAVDHPIMRHVVNRYAHMLGIRNPLALIPLSPSNTAAVTSLSIAATSASPLPALAGEAVEPEGSVVTTELLQSTPNDSREDVTSSPTESIVATPASSASTPSPPSPRSMKLAQVPPQLVKSPEAIAQLRVANSILKKIHKPNRPKTQTHAQSQMKGKALGALNPPQKSQRLQKGTAQSPTATTTGHPGSAEVKGNSNTEKKGATSKLRGFMGNWF